MTKKMFGNWRKQCITYKRTMTEVTVERTENFSVEQRC